MTKPKTVSVKAKSNITIADLEKAMGRKASHISDFKFDPEDMSFGRTITFALTKAVPSKGRK